MRRLLQSGAVSAVLLALSQVVPVSLSAGVFCNHGLLGCRRNPCRCQAMPSQPQFTMQPQLQATPVLTYKNVTRTEYRVQAQTVTVPVTTQQTVTVDEGGWQKVWVPRIVQKQIPTTTYQQQTVYNQVPYQVSRQIPHVTYQQRTTMVPRVTGHVRSSCNACGTGNTWTSHTHSHAGIAGSPATVGSSPVVLGPIIGAPFASNPMTFGGSTAIPMTTQSGPVQLGRELQPLNSTSSSSSTSSETGPVPDPSFLEIPQASNSGEWTPVLAATPEPVRQTRPTASRTAAASGMFVPAPSAASVWRTRIR